MLERLENEDAHDQFKVFSVRLLARADTVTANPYFAANSRSECVLLRAQDGSLFFVKERSPRQYIAYIATIVIPHTVFVRADTHQHGVKREYVSDTGGKTTYHSSSCIAPQNEARAWSSSNNISIKSCGRPPPSTTPSRDTGVTPMAGMNLASRSSRDGMRRQVSRSHNNWSHRVLRNMQETKKHTCPRLVGHSSRDKSFASSDISALGQLAGLSTPKTSNDAPTCLRR